MTKRILFCGGRDYPEGGIEIFSKVEELKEEFGDILIIHGGARGADTTAGEAAHMNFLPCLVVPANWPKYGKAAGPIRNEYMLKLGEPSLVVAAPGDSGTEDMVRRAEKAGIPVIRLEMKE